MRWETKVYQREELYEAIWREPVQSVARRDGISDVALGKMCRKLRVPVPPRGYWAKKAAGQAEERPPLPALLPGEPTAHRVQYRGDSIRQSDMAETTKEQLAREKNAEQHIVVADTLSEPHPLVALSKPLLQAVKELPRPRNQHRCLHIIVTEALLDRALRVMDALLKALESRGFEVVVTEPVRHRLTRTTWGDCETPSLTKVRIGEILLEFALTEGSTLRKPPTPPKGSVSGATRRREVRLVPIPPPGQAQERFQPTGRLTLRILNAAGSGMHVSWSDGGVQRLENCLNDFVAGLIKTAEWMRLAHLEAEREQRQRQEAQQRREETVRRQERQAQRRADLHSRVAEWSQAQAIRQFAAAVESDAQARGKDTSEASALGRWLAWSRRWADRLERVAIRTVLRRPVPPPTTQPPGIWR